MENTGLLKITIQCLEKTFKSVDKKEREDAENTLKTLEREINSHCKTILYIIKDDQTLSSKLSLNLLNFIIRR